MSDLKSIYEKAYRDGDTNFFSKFKDGRDTSDTHKVLEELWDWSGKHVLDFGSGPGRTAELLCARGATYDGIDFAEPAIVEARRKAIPGAKFHLGSLELLEGLPKYDAVVSLGTLEHMEDPEDTLRRLGGQVKEGGRVIVTCPNWTNPRGYVLMTLHHLFHLRITLTDRHFITPPTMERWAGAAGLRVEDFRTFDHSRGWGENCLRDLSDRLPKVFREKGPVPEAEIRNLVEWLGEASGVNTQDRVSGATALYVLKRRS